MDCEVCKEDGVARQAWVDVQLLAASNWPIGITTKPIPVCCSHLLSAWHLYRQSQDRMLFEYNERKDAPANRP